MENVQASPDRFATAIAERLNRVVPSGFRVRAQGARVQLYFGSTIRGGSDNAILVAEQDGRTVAELVECAARGILNDVQTHVMEMLREQWPLGDQRQAGNPGARVQGDSVSMWFGDEQRPLVVLGPLELVDVLEGAA
jgi:hypothetical protein